MCGPDQKKETDNNIGKLKRKVWGQYSRCQNLQMHKLSQTYFENLTAENRRLVEGLSITQAAKGKSGCAQKAPGPRMGTILSRLRKLLFKWKGGLSAGTSQSRKVGDHSKPAYYDLATCCLATQRFRRTPKSCFMLCRVTFWSGCKRKHRQ